MGPDAREKVRSELEGSVDRVDKALKLLDELVALDSNP
jgi:hypothetical protein